MIRINWQPGLCLDCSARVCISAASHTVRHLVRLHRPANHHGDDHDDYGDGGDDGDDGDSMIVMIMVMVMRVVIKVMILYLQPSGSI